MDRLYRFLPPRLAAPLATLTIAGLLALGWLAVWDRLPLGQTPRVGLTASGRDRLPVEPRRMPVAEVALRMSPASPSAPLPCPVDLPSHEAAALPAPPAPLIPPPDAKPARPPIAPPDAAASEIASPWPSPLGGVFPDPAMQSLQPEGIASPLPAPTESVFAPPAQPSPMESVFAPPAPPVPTAFPSAETPAGGSSEFDPSARSVQLEEIAREADRHTRRGFELASKRAYHSARAEFIQALRLVAQGLDAEHRTRVHSQALGAGLDAIDEAEDFLPTGSRLEAQLDLPGLIAGHRTAVLKGAPPEALHSFEALRCYLSFAQEQLATAAGGEVAGSMALHALGKLSAAVQSGETPAAEARAVVFYQAAMIVCPANALAANDLGVLLARSGRLDDARAVFEHGLAMNDHPATRYNLALVENRGPVARVASLPSGGRPPVGASTRQVQWVDPNAFARSYTATPDAHQPPPAQQASAAPSLPASQDNRASGFWPKAFFSSPKK